MAIAINNTKENANDKTIFFTIEYDGKDYKWHGDIPKDANAQSYLNAKENTLKLEILRKQYPKAVVVKLENKTDLESFEAWVSNGCKNVIEKEEITLKDLSVKIVKSEKVINKKNWVDTHS